MSVILVTDGSQYALYINGAKHSEVEPYTARLVLELAGIYYTEIELDAFPDELA
jgi:hypothetical protein